MARQLYFEPMFELPFYTDSFGKACADNYIIFVENSVFYFYGEQNERVFKGNRTNPLEESWIDTWFTRFEFDQTEDCEIRKFPPYVEERVVKILAGQYKCLLEDGCTRVIFDESL